MNQDLARLTTSWGDWKPRSRDLEDVEARAERRGTAIEFSGPAVIIFISPQLQWQLSRILQAFQPPTVVNRPRPAIGPGEALTRRELEVLELIAKGRRNQEIAQELFVTLDTVKKHTGKILRKLGAASRTRAVARVRELDLIP